MAVLIPGGRGIAQPTSVSARLMVHPHEMATATHTDRAGEFALDSLDEDLVYVPRQCVGTGRCPLIVFLHGGGYGAREVLQWQRPVADKYGMIVLAPVASKEPPPNQGPVDAMLRSFNGRYNWPMEKTVDDPNVRNIDAALKQVLRRFAVDPDKIALVGRCQSGDAALFWGGDNLDVFSRIVVISGGGLPSTADIGPRHTATEFFLDNGIPESGGSFAVARQLRRLAYPVKLVVGLRTHAHQMEDYDFMGRWLQESWATPNPAARPAPRVVADPLPVLTTDVLTKMTTFWKSFQKEPDATKTAARRAYLRDVAVPIGTELASVVMVDMPALVAEHPSVAAALKAAGLTAQQHDAYRVALISAYATTVVEKNAGAVESTSVVGKNVAFMRAHLDEFQALEATAMWVTP